MKEEFAKTSYGRIHYVDAGEGQPVLLTHSGGSSLHEFEHNLGRLARHSRVIAWDLPGHGDSAPFTVDLSVEDYTNAAVQLLDHLGIEKAHFVGASIGGFMAIEMGASHADRVRKLVIVDTQLRTRQWWVDNWPMVEGMFAEVTQPRERVAPRFKALSEETLRRWNIDRAKAGARSMMGVVWAARAYDALGQLAKVKPPTLTMLGGAGPCVDCAGDFRRLLPEGKLEVVEGCGHFPMIDEPEVFVDLLVDFLQLRPSA